MSFLPPSTNFQYAGSKLAARFLALLGALTIAPGLVHTFLPDGGAGVIAGMDLSGNGASVIGVFAWAGATQIVWGFALLVAALRYQSLVPPLLALVVVERTLIALNLWLLKAPESGRHPPEAYATLIALPLMVGALLLALRAPKESP
ncbi:MAG: hypothetical protein WEF50_12825 [Myxococcota bacterium]